MGHPLRPFRRADQIRHRQRLAGICRFRHGASARAGNVRARSEHLSGLCLRRRPRPAGDVEIRHSRSASDVRIRSALAAPLWIRRPRHSHAGWRTVAMKFTLSWIKDHLDTDADATAVADKLTSIGLEVESVEDAGARLKDFVVGYVVSAEKHPNADKLKLCMVDVGEGAPIQVVCGAPNAHTGMKGVFARPGTVIPASNEVLKVGTIRGVESRGMLCSERELLLSDEHNGIIELAEDAKVGGPAAAALGLTDPVIDIAITPNRGDATSAFGVARDLAASGLGTLKDGRVEIIEGTFKSPKSVALDFTPDTADACPVFA